MRDFTSKRPVRPRLDPETETKAMDEYIKALNLDGLTLLPGESKPQEMVGVDPDHLKQQMARNQEMKDRLLRDMAATWKCLQCKQEIPGKHVRVRVRGGKWETVQGVKTLVGGEEQLACPKCDGPVVKTVDPYCSKLI